MSDFQYNKKLEVIETMEYIDKKKRVHQKLLLTELEKYMSPDSQEFKLMRKAILDSTNDFSRSVVRAIFGDTFEGIIK